MTVALSPNGVNVYQQDSAPLRLVVATHLGVSILERADRNAPWGLVRTTLGGSHVSSLMVEPVAGGVFAGAHSGGLFFSADGGETWERRTAGIAEDEVFSLKLLLNQSGKVTLFAGTQPVALYRSTDNGLSWDELRSLHDVPGQEKWMFPPPPHIAHIKTVAFDPRDADTFYVGVEQGALLKTTDGGSTWRELDGPWHADDPTYRDVHQIVVRPSDPDQVYLSTGIGLYRTGDAGESWARLTPREFRIGYPDQLILSPRDDSELFIAGALTDPSVWRRTHHASATVLRSRDSGKSWEEAGHGLPEDMHGNIEAMTIAVHPDGFTLFAGDTDGAVYTSEDGAGTWALAVSGLGAVSKAGHYRNLQPVAA